MKEQPKLTFSPDYIADREKLDTLSRSVHNQCLQINKHLKTIQITDFKFKINEPTDQHIKALAWWKRVLIWLRKKLIK